MFRDRHKNILKEAVGVLQCLRADKGAGEAKISHLPSAEISEEGIIWEKEKAGPKHIDVLQNHCSNWESLLGQEQCLGAATLQARAGFWLWQSALAARSVAEGANPTRALPESWV